MVDWNPIAETLAKLVGGAGAYAAILRVWRQIDRVKDAKSKGDADVAKASSEAIVDTIERFERLADAAEKRAERAEERELSAVQRADRAEQREQEANERARQSDMKVKDLEKRIAKLEAILASRRVSDPKP